MSHLEKNLINLLKMINEDDSSEVNNGIYNIKNPFVNAVNYLANQFLIGDDGHPDRENMAIIAKAGFPIYPGEMDRFGWLTGKICLKRGFIIFG
jgi:hypothetical protein